MVKTIVYLSLGSNIGNKKKNICSAINQIKNSDKIFFIKSSSFYKTSAVGSKLSSFINAVVEISTDLTVNLLLKKIKSIEIALGRDATQPHLAPRIIDIDILFFGNMEVNTKRLRVPHKKIKERLFVLVPLLELKPNMHYLKERKKLLFYKENIIANDKNQKVEKYEN